MPVSTFHSERGTSTVEQVLVLPVVITTIFMVIQFGVYLHAAHVTEAAAQRGLRAGQGESRTAADAHEAATAFLAVTGGVIDPDITVTRTTTTASVQVRGAAPMVMPGLNLSVVSTAEAPVERFVPRTSQ